MNLASSILGTSTVRRLEESAGAPVLQVGSDRLTRRDLARVGCYNFLAARLLTNALTALRIPNLRHLYDQVPPASLALPHLGSVCLAVLGAAFEAKGIGGATPLESYAKKHAGDNGIVTFDTYKQRERAGEERPRRRRKSS